MELYKILENSGRKDIFIYIIIIILCLVIFKRFTVGINVILGLFVAVVIILYRHEDIIINKKRDIDYHNLKLETIKPHPIKLDKYNDIVDYLFSIQEFYEYNQQSYEEMIDNIDMFIIIYEELIVGERFCENKYDMASVNKNNALNALHSIFFNIPSEKNITNKFNRSLLELENILNNYLEKMYNICQEKLVMDGYSIERKIINRGPKPSNIYSSSRTFSYDFF